MRLLLDTHALIWWLTDSPKALPKQRALRWPIRKISPSAPQRSAATRSPTSSGSASFPPKSPRICRKLCVVPAYPAHHVTLDHMVAAGQLPGPHRDPWDQPFMAQAMREGFTICVTLNPIFRRTYGVPVFW